MDRAIGWYIGVKMLFKKFYLIQCLRNVGICTSIAGVPNPAPAPAGRLSCTVHLQP